MWWLTTNLSRNFFFKLTTMEKEISPKLSDVICKIKEQQDLSAEEELLYLIHIEKIPEDEAQQLIFKWYDKMGLPTTIKQAK